MIGAYVRWRRLLAVVVTCLAVVACGRSSKPEPVREEGPSMTSSNPTPVDADELKRLMQECNAGRVALALQDVLGSPASADLLIFLGNSWDDGGGDSSVKVCMQKDLVRVYAANALAQAQANQMLELPQLPAVLDTLRGSLKSPSAEIAQIAMMGLGDFLTEGDVAQLSQIALGNNSANARVAYGTLVLSCEPHASEALDRLAKTDQARAALVRDFRQRMQEGRRLKCDSEPVL